MWYRTILCRLSMTPGMIIPMIAGPQGTRPEIMLFHLSPRARLPRTIYVLLSSLCLCTNTNIYIQIRLCCQSVPADQAPCTINVSVEYKNSTVFQYLSICKGLKVKGQWELILSTMMLYCCSTDPSVRREVE